MIKQNQERLNVKTMFVFILQDPSGYCVCFYWMFCLLLMSNSIIIKFILLTSLINYFYVDNTVSLCMKSGRAASLKIQELTETLLSWRTYILHIL
ncbi:hypothetical protein DUN18_26065 [Escherichia coli]|nr:hypothetical protein [Escherichia coli]